MKFADRVASLVESIKSLDTLDCPDEVAELDAARDKIDNALNKVFDNLAADIQSDHDDEDEECERCGATDGHKRGCGETMDD